MVSGVVWYMAILGGRGRRGGRGAGGIVTVSNLVSSRDIGLVFWRAARGFRLFSHEKKSRGQETSVAVTLMCAGGSAVRPWRVYRGA